MPNYVVTTTATVTLYTRVRGAKSKKEAKALAFIRDVQSLCHECSTGSPNAEWALAGELDGTPDYKSARIEEV